MKLKPFFWCMVAVILRISDSGRNTHNPYFHGSKWFLKAFVDLGEPVTSYAIENCNISFSPGGSRCTGQLCNEFPSEYPETNISLLIVEETSITNLKPYSFNNFTQLKTLYCIRNQIKILENDTFFGLNNLEYLNLAGNFISAVHNGAFNHLNKLKQLILVKNELKALKPLAEALVPTLPSLEFINLGLNRFKQILKDDFEILTPNKLMALGLMFCEINFIQPISFNVFTNLHHLSLRKNDNVDSRQLTDVFTSITGVVPLEELDLTGISSITRQEHLFSALNDLKLRVLYLNAIETTAINDNMFPTMDYLEELYLNKAHIRHISPKAFHPLKALKVLGISKNSLSAIPNGLLLPHLEVLDLSGFPHSSLGLVIHDFIFRNMTQLKRLDLSYKLLLSLNRNTFVGLHNLEELSLVNCRLQIIKERSFSPLKSLKILNLDGNRLFLSSTVITTNLFMGLNNLEKLILSNNNFRFKNGDYSPFSNLFNLEYLDLSSNLIESLNRKHFANLTTLKEVYLKKNNIMGWKTRLFTNNHSMTLLDLSKNKIRTVSSEMIKDLRNFNRVNLSHNPFACNCELLPFLNWANSTDVLINYAIGKKSYVCQSPKDVENLQSIHSKLSKNCKIDIKPAILGITAGLLMLLLVLVVVSYVRRTRLKKNPVFINPNEEYQYDAFVSYSANDSEWVFGTLLPHLENSSDNLKLCVYDRDFIAGRGISECIVESIKLSIRTILILSNNFLQSPWCRFETDLAHHTLIDEEREGLLLIKLEDLDTELITPPINYLLKVKIHLNWSQKPNEQEIFWKKLNAALGKRRIKKAVRDDAV